MSPNFLPNYDTITKCWSYSMNKNVNSEKNDDFILNIMDEDFDQDLDEYSKNNSGEYLLSAKTRRRIENLLEDRKLKDELDDFIEF